MSSPESSTSDNTPQPYLDFASDETNLAGLSWMTVTVIEDDDLMFGGKPLCAWYEEDRRRLSSCVDVDDEEETRGRQRERVPVVDHHRHPHPPRKLHHTPQHQVQQQHQHQRQHHSKTTSPAKEGNE